LDFWSLGVIIYEFLKIILRNEFKNICQKNMKTAENSETVVKDKKKKLRRKNITIEIQPELELALV
jgi:beta-lactamase regulating signal transducer with metallopeptidase domain